jgi:hypothetical protein
LYGNDRATAGTVTQPSALSLAVADAALGSRGQCTNKDEYKNQL